MIKLIDITGKVLSGEWGEDDELGTGIPVLRTTNFTNDGVINYDKVVTRNIQKKNLNEKYLQKGDIIIEKSGGSDKQPVGRVVYFDGEGKKYLFNNFTGVLRIRDKERWNPRYVFYSLYDNYLKGGTREYENKTTGLHNLKTDKYVNDFQVPDIEYGDQCRIVEGLDCVNSTIRARKQQLEKLDELVKARFVEMFGTPEHNEKTIRTLPMTELCEIIDGDRGTNYPKQEEFSDNGFCLFLNAKNVTASGFSFENRMFITAEKDKLLRKGKLSRGDVVLTTRGTIGNLAFYDDTVPYEHIRINSGMVILRMKRECIIERFFIEQFKMQLSAIKEKIASGSAQPQLPISTMNKIMLLVPNIKEQERYAAFVEQTDKSRVEIQKSLEQLETLKKALMQKYFG